MPHRRRKNCKKVGSRVCTTMGVRRTGTVIEPFNWKDSNDGTYRGPTSKEKAVWVKWNDGTKGWIHDAFVAEKE